MCIRDRSRPVLQATVLQYYWFRLSDAVLPVVLVLTVLFLIARFRISRPVFGGASFILLALLGTMHLADRPYMTLSGGEKQRVVIAGALAQEPEILLLDEPTTSLDLAYQLEVASLMSRLNQNHEVTMVLATHDLNLAASVCDRLVLVSSGRILAQGPTRDVLTSATIQQLYDVEADVHVHEPSGQLMVLPIRRKP